MAISTSLTLLDRLQQQQLDETAWSELVDTYGSLILCWCRNSGLPEEAVADVFQEIFVRIFTSIAGFERRRPGSFCGWLLSITRSQIGNFWRNPDNSQRVTTKPTDFFQQLEALSEPLSSSSVREFMPQKEQSNLIHRTLKCLRPRFNEQTWTMFWRTVVKDEKPRYVAADMGVTSNTVRTARYRVLRHLRTELDGLFD